MIMNGVQGANPFKLLMVVGSANDIFVYNMAKWLKKSMDIQIDIYEFYPSNQQGYSNEYYDCVESAPHCNIKYLRIFVNPIIQGRSLDRYLKNKHYDAIHLHWMTPSTVMAKSYKQHCRKLYATFWGGEFDNLTLLMSNRLYQKRLTSLANDIDCIVNSPTFERNILQNLPSYNGTFYSGKFGSAPLECLYQLVGTENKEQSKAKLSFPTDKISVMLGYSGKRLHRHIDIVKELSKHNNLKTKIHLFAPMTRGADSTYVEMLEEELRDSGYSYTIFKGNFLTDEEVARIRNATDIALQLSAFDGFSRSVVECLCAKSILLYGNWLGYHTYMTEEQFQGIEVQSIHQAITILPEIIDNIKDYRKMTESNYENGKTHNLWSSCIQDWVKAYRIVNNLPNNVEIC